MSQSEDSFIPSYISSADLLILNWNCSSYYTQKDIIYHALQVYQPDIVTIQESKITSATQLPTFSQYNSYARLHEPNKKVARGLLTLVKKSLIHEELPDSFSTNNVDILGIRYMDSKSHWHHIFNIYVAVDSQFDANILHFDKALILGDFNARHLTWCTRTNKLGRKLIKHIENNNCVVLNDRQPTTRFNTALDLAITKANYNIHWTWDVFHLWTNDHFGQYIVHHSTRLANKHQLN